MENEHKNTKPTVSTDTDKNGREHNRSEDGRFTANPNYQGNNQEQEPAANQHKEVKTNTHYNQTSNEFDRTIAEPCFMAFVEDSLNAMFVGDREEGQIGVAKMSTEYEDKHLGVDCFIGNAGKENPYLYQEPEVEKVDLKTIKRGLGGNIDFYNHPRVQIGIYKSYYDTFGNAKMENQLKSHINTHFAFQVLYSPKHPQDIHSINDIEEAKLYYVQKDPLVKFINKNQLFAKELPETFCDMSNKEVLLEDMVRDVALKNHLGFGKKRDEYNKNTTYIVRDRETGIEIYLTVDDRKGMRTARYSLPTKAFITDHDLAMNTYKFRKVFNKQV